MSVIDEVKSRVDIVDIVNRYTPLKRAGTSHKGLCPFHSERTPSFVVFQNSQTWRCFGACGDGGDVFSFLMKKENLEFREVLQKLAQEVGVDLSESENDPEHRQKSSLYEINTAAAKYFQEILAHHPQAQVARDYLRRRSIDDATASRFQIGFALDNWNALRDFLSARGFSLDQQLDAGLLKRNDERDSIYDAFRNRVMIPISDRQGRVIGFGGRVLDDSLPKYLNTSETPLFHKSHVIYGIDLAHQAIRANDQVVIVEGYMDVIAAHQHGYANVVACMGTALTAEQLKQLQRYTSHFVLSLDSDAAGQAATIRGLNQARQSLERVQRPTVTATGVRMAERLTANLAILSMPEGKDPDEFIRKNPQAWPELVKQAKPLVDFYFDVVRRQYDTSSATGKGQVVAELAPLIAELDDEIERQHYVQQLSRLVQVDEMTIVGRVQATMRTKQAGIPSVQHRGQKRRPNPPGSEPTAKYGEGVRFGEGNSNHESSRTNETGRHSEAVAKPELAIGRILRPKSNPPDQEDHLLATLLRQPDLFFWLVSETESQTIEPFNTGDLGRVDNQEIFRMLRVYLNGNEPWDIELYQELLPSELHGRLAELVAYGAQLPPTNEAQLQIDIFRTLVKMRMQRLREEQKQMNFFLAEAKTSQDREAFINFSGRYDKIRIDLGHLQDLNVNWTTKKGPRVNAQSKG